MLVGTLIHVVRRRWYVVLVGALLTAAAAAAVPTLEPPRYSVSATALLSHPRCRPTVRPPTPTFNSAG